MRRTGLDRQWTKIYLYSLVFLYTVETYCKVRKRHKYTLENDKASERDRRGKKSRGVRDLRLGKRNNCQAALVFSYSSPVNSRQVLLATSLICSLSIVIKGKITLLWETSEVVQFQSRIKLGRVHRITELILTLKFSSFSLYQEDSRAQRSYCQRQRQDLGTNKVFKES